MPSKPNAASNLNVIGETVFYAPYSWEDKMIHAMATSGGEPQPIGSMLVDNLVVTSDYAYFSASDTSTWVRSIYRMKVDGTGLEVLVENGPIYFYIEGDYIYYAYYPPQTYDEGAIVRVKKDGTGKEQVCDFYADPRLIVSDGWIYCIGREDQCLYRIRTDGSEIDEVTDYRCAGFNVVDGYMYLSIAMRNPETASDEPLPEIRKIRDSGGGEPEILAKLEQRHGAPNICVVDGWIYFEARRVIWADGGYPEYTMYRVKTDGTGLEMLGRLDPQIDW